MDNLDNTMELEQLRTQYAAMKEKLEKQEIISDRLMYSVFKSKVRDIHSKSWITYFCGFFVLITSPFVFHLNPVMQLSWAFVVGTDILMIACLYFTAKWNSEVKTPYEGCNLLEFAQSIKDFKRKNLNWLKYVAGPCILGWLSWMCAEYYVRTGSVQDTAKIMIPLLIGGAIGGIFGFCQQQKILRTCDEIIDQINS